MCIISISTKKYNKSHFFHALLYDSIWWMVICSLAISCAHLANVILKNKNDGCFLELSVPREKKTDYVLSLTVHLA